MYVHIEDGYNNSTMGLMEPFYVHAQRNLTHLVGRRPRHIASFPYLETEWDGFVLLLILTNEKNTSCCDVGVSRPIDATSHDKMKTGIPKGSVCT